MLVKPEPSVASCDTPLWLVAVPKLTVAALTLADIAIANTKPAENTLDFFNMFFIFRFLLTMIVKILRLLKIKH